MLKSAQKCMRMQPFAMALMCSRWTQKALQMSNQRMYKPSKSYETPSH